MENGRSSTTSEIPEVSGSQEIGKSSSSQERLEDLPSELDDTSVLSINEPQAQQRASEDVELATSVQEFSQSSLIISVDFSALSASEGLTGLEENRSEVGISPHVSSAGTHTASTPPATGSGPDIGPDAAFLNPDSSSNNSNPSSEM